MTAPGNTVNKATRRLAKRIFAAETLYRLDRLSVWGPETALEATCATLNEDARAAAACDFLLADLDLTNAWPAPDDVFSRLVWGGQMLLVSSDRARIEDAAHRYDRHHCFDLEVAPAPTRGRLRGGLKWLGLATPRRFYAVIRRVSLLAPGEHSDRSTFDVRLVRKPELGPGYIVRKQVPTHRRVAGRLHDRFPDAGHELLISRATKLVGKVFPVFLTREAGFLQLLSRDLPATFANRVPKALGLEKAPDGTVKRLYMTWLRMDRDPIDQIDFAIQATELLSVVHDTV
ncbi:MAG: hypothetical protein V3V20_02760, partial [Algisphaera sp.]